MTTIFLSNIFMRWKNIFIFIVIINGIILFLGKSKGELYTRRSIHNYDTKVFNVIMNKISCVQYPMESPILLAQCISMPVNNQAGEIALRCMPHGHNNAEKALNSNFLSFVAGL